MNAPVRSSSCLKQVVLGILLAVCLHFAVRTGFADESRPIVGAIRWDAWQEGGGIQAAVEKTLGPGHWHYRLPFFAKVTGTDSVVFDGNSQAVMDQEINYAADAGLDYWSFCIYDDQSGMSNGLHLYLNSPVKSRINFTLNLQGGHVAGNASNWEAEVARYVNYFKDASYQKVLGNRPLVFLFGAINPTDKLQKATVMMAMLQRLRDASTAAGLGNPYIVFQGWNANKDFNTMQDYGLDAIGAYAVGAGSLKGTPYTALAAKAHRFWEEGKATGANIVPLVSAGWDNRPRYENPVPWITGSQNYTLSPKPAELADHLADALNWTRRNRTTVTPANTVLIYAWNENDEGGWLVPDKGQGTARLDAIRRVISESDFSARFENPPPACRPNINRHGVPKDPGTTEQLIEERRAEGYGGFTCNVNWTPDYLKNGGQMEMFFRFCEAVHAKGMNLWLYDEKWYPSGMAGGDILAEHPEWETEGLLFKSVTVTGPVAFKQAVLPGKIVLAEVLPVRDGQPAIGQGINLLDQVKDGTLTWDAPEGTWLVAMVATDTLYKGFQAGSDRGGQAPHYPSLLVPEVTRRFIELTHMKYAEALGKPLGSLFFSTFTDEPSLMALPFRDLGCGVYPWKECLSQEIFRRHGWQVGEKLLPMALDDGPEGKRLRYQYFSTVSDMISQNYFRTIRDYCRSQGFRSGGHLLLEESLMAQVMCYGNIFACYREMDVPGIDVLTASPGKTRRYLYSARLAASAAELNGTTQVMAEPCPVTDLKQNGGKEGSTLEAKGTLNRQMIGGVTLFNNYLKLENANAQQKRELNTCLARISTLMGGGVRASEIAVVFPAETMWTLSRPLPAHLSGWDATAGGAPEARKVEAAFDAVSDFLYEGHREFSYLDARALTEGSVRAGELHHGASSWKILILPRVDTLPMAAWNAVHEFWKTGGAVVAIGALPQNTETEFPSAVVQKMFADVFSGKPNPAGGVGVLWPEKKSPSWGEWLDSRLPRRFTLSPAHARVLTSHKVVDGHQVIFLINDSGKPTGVRFAWEGGEKMEMWNPQNGKSEPVVCPVQINLGPYEGRLLRTVAKKE